MSKKERLYAGSNTIRTASGLYINVFDPDPNSICIEDIAHALSFQCRFSGHLPKFYSVADHSINCASLVGDPELRLAALMHDASEAYLVDIPRPIKPLLTNYKQIEDNLMQLIANKYGFKYPLHPHIIEYDEAMLVWEWEGIMLERINFPFEIKSPKKTREEFISLFKKYTTKFG